MRRAILPLVLVFAFTQQLCAQPTATKCPCTTPGFCKGIPNGGDTFTPLPLPPRCAPAPGSSCPPGVDCSGCKNFDPKPFPHLQGFCHSQKMRNYDDITREFLAAATAPNTVGIPGTGFPMYGCTLGCLFGNRINTWLFTAPYADGSWTGKCFNYFDTYGLPNFMDNIVSPLAVLMPDWNKTGLPGVRAISAQVGWSGTSILDGQPVWVIEYTNVQAYFQLGVKRMFDECRWTEYSPNSVGSGQHYLLCKAYFEFKNNNTQAYTGKYIEWLQFGFMQTCSRSSPGAYAINPNDRIIV